mmetsp:Transcript_2551/g.4369  ORF Transcript_2551/g.4369 Transcript_2551/m.4369 type:complete len:229 (-) Transcript_2551:146-832(-)
MSTDRFMECPDGHRCQNDSVCTENPYDEGAYYCDCDEAFLDHAYAGLYCEHKATTYCTLNKEISSISFCTNEGTCKAETSNEQAHLGCDCPAEYEGDHCQFVSGSKPDGWPFDGSSGPSNAFGYPDSGGGGGMSGAVTALVVLVVLGVVGGFAFYLYRKKKGSWTSTTKDLGSSPELALDPDGEVLQESMKYSDGNISAASMSGTMDTVDGQLEDVAIDSVNSKGEII